MAPEVYELVAMGMRYWFVLLAVLIAISCWRWLRADSKAYQAALDLLPDAGLVGELVDLHTGEGIPLTREGTLGSGRACDMRVQGLRKREVSLEFEDGKGVKVIPLRGAHPVTLDGAPARNGAALHGTRIAIGDRQFRVRLFAGLDVPDREVPEIPPVSTWVEPEVMETPVETVASEEALADAPHETQLDADQPQVAAQQTWQYAVPPELLHGHAQDAVMSESVPAERRSRLGRRRRRDRDHAD